MENQPSTAESVDDLRAKIIASANSVRKWLHYWPGEAALHRPRSPEQAQAREYGLALKADLLRELVRRQRVADYLQELADLAGDAIVHDALPATLRAMEIGSFKYEGDAQLASYLTRACTGYRYRGAFVPGFYLKRLKARITELRGEERFSSEGSESDEKRIDEVDGNDSGESRVFLRMQDLQEMQFWGDCCRGLPSAPRGTASAVYFYVLRTAALTCQTKLRHPVPPAGLDFTEHYAGCAECLRDVMNHFEPFALHESVSRREFTPWGVKALLAEAGEREIQHPENALDQRLAEIRQNWMNYVESHAKVGGRPVCRLFLRAIQSGEPLWRGEKAREAKEERKIQ
jgi:hypothetical protein